MKEGDLHRPLRTEPTRVRRTYTGGEWFSTWHGDGTDDVGNRPEEWIASVVPAVNTGFPPQENEGLSLVENRGERILLRDLLEQFPETMLGTTHAEKFGAQPGVLAKIIDSAERLSIQVHPDRAFAAERLHSSYGKTECWHILSTRKTAGEDAYLLMGFRPGVTRELWEELYRRQDVDGMIRCLHRIVPRPGDTWLIRGGVPHAIGPGCCLVEIQEPTDYTFRSEKHAGNGALLPDELIHRGLGDEALMDCFHYDALEEQELYDRCRVEPVTEQYGESVSRHILIGAQQTPCFSMEKFCTAGRCLCKTDGNFSFAAVLEGEGSISWNGGRMTLRSGDQFFCPAALSSFELEGAPGQVLTTVWFHPPGAAPHTVHVPDRA